MEKLSCVECRPPCPLGDLPLHEMGALNGLIRSVLFLPEQVIFEQGDPPTAAAISFAKVWRCCGVERPMGAGSWLGLLGRGI